MKSLIIIPFAVIWITELLKTSSSYLLRLGSLCYSVIGCGFGRRHQKVAIKLMYEVVGYILELHQLLGGPDNRRDNTNINWPQREWQDKTRRDKDPAGTSVVHMDDTDRWTISSPSRAFHLNEEWCREECKICHPLSRLLFLFQSPLWRL